MLQGIQCSSAYPELENLSKVWHNYLTEYYVAFKSYNKLSHVLNNSMIINLKNF